MLFISVLLFLGIALLSFILSTTTNKDFLLLIGFVFLGAAVLSLNYSVPVEGKTWFNEIDSFDGWCAIEFGHQIRGEFLPVTWSERVALQEDACLEVIQGKEDMTFNEFLEFKARGVV